MIIGFPRVHQNLPRVRNPRQCTASDLTRKFACFCRNSVDLGHDPEKAFEGHNSAGERRRAVGLSNERGSDGNAPRCRTKQLGGSEDTARAWRQPQLQGHQRIDAALLQRHIQDRPDALRNAAS